MMEFQIPNFAPAAPEIFVSMMSIFILLVVSFARTRSSQIAYYLTQLTLIVAGGLSLYPIRDDSAGEMVFTFGQMYVADPLGDLLKIASIAAVFCTLVYGRRYLRERKLESAEYYLLALFAALGIMVMISAGTLITVYIGLEMLSLASYALVAINRDSVRSTEAAMKYFVLGSLASGLLLYGMSMVYGATHYLGLWDIANALLDPASVNGTVLLFGLVFVVAGVAFKLGVVPFHMWLPDTYEGAPSSVTLLIASASKLAAFAMACRLLAFGLWDLVGQWKLMLLIAGTASIVLGNLAAIRQTNLKRMLAYSGISHMGFLVLGFAAVTSTDSLGAYGSALFYVLTYVLATLGGFGIMLLLARAGHEAENIEDFRGLNKRSSWWAAMMSVVMLSMAGIPFFVGFFAKLYVLNSLWNSGFAWLTVVAVIMSLIGAYYYLSVVKTIYFDEPEDHEPIGGGIGSRALLSVNVFALILLGLFPGALMDLCVTVVRRTLQ
jgi:NADH-quinone oxidoreductase subunit N